LQPHKSEYWLFPKIADWQVFVAQVALICQLILSAIQEVSQPEKAEFRTYLFSVDEKTGIQALERLEQTAPASQGGGTRKEFEYTRHGTTTLIAALNVGTGQVQNYVLSPTRTEHDYHQFIEQTAQPILDTEPEARIVFLADQLNTHLSESLVLWAAMVNQIDNDLGIKGKEGILHNQQTRRVFLENEAHRIRFVFTPKHCSWLNPIENWFAKLQRHVITNGNFNSITALNLKIEKYISFYNKTLVKPLKWKFKGFIKAQMLANFKPSST
jgi:transposase